MISLIKNFLVDLVINDLNSFMEQEVEEFFIRIIDLDEKEGIMTIVISESAKCLNFLKNNADEGRFKVFLLSSQHF